MVKRLCGLIIVLVLLGGIVLPVSVAQAMTKTLRNEYQVLDSATVSHNGDNWKIQWQINVKARSSTETQVKINLYQNGILLRTLADNISIGSNGNGSWDWGNRASWDWGNKGKGRSIRGANFHIEVVSMTNSVLLVKSEKFVID